MSKAAFKTVGIRVFSCLCLMFFITTSSGCATRALMSSDRYEKPKQELQQLRSSNIISPFFQSDWLQVEHVVSTIKLPINNNNCLI